MSEQLSSLRLMFPKTLSESVYKFLKESILSNKFKAGQKINEKEIASLFQVSSILVREAIFMFESEEKGLRFDVVNPWNRTLGCFEGIYINPKSGEMRACGDPRRCSKAEGV